MIECEELIDRVDNAWVGVASNSGRHVLDFAAGPIPTEAKVVDFSSFDVPIACASSMTATLDECFAAMLPDDPRVEHVFWDLDDDTLRVYVVLPEPDFALESPIYEAQLAFMDKFPTIACDFYVLYRFGKPPMSVAPQHARLVR